MRIGRNKFKYVVTGISKLTDERMLLSVPCSYGTAIKIIDAYNKRNDEHGMGAFADLNLEIYRE